MFSDRFIDSVFAISEGAFRFPPAPVQAPDTLLQRSGSGSQVRGGDSIYAQPRTCEQRRRSSVFLPYDSHASRGRGTKR